MVKMECSIEWNIADYEARLAKVGRGNLLQSSHYARAVCPLYGQTYKTGAIMINGAEAGLFVIEEASALKGLFHAVILDRGPLWYENFGMPDQVEAFFAALARAFPRRMLRRRRIIPEIADLEGNRAMMRRLGYVRIPRKGYETSYLDLRKDAQDLRARLKKNFRNSLSKAESGKLILAWDEPLIHLPFLIGQYEADKALRGYGGASAKTLAALGHEFGKHGRILLGRALLDNAQIAAILIFCHGSSATYQVGWTSDLGRKQGAHHLLLWNSLEKLQTMGIKWFDLGGINDDTAKGVTQFKDGLGGEHCVLAGQYC